MQELFFLCEVSEIGAFMEVFISNDLVNLTSFFGCNVQQERNREFMMYMPCYKGHGKIAK